MKYYITAKYENVINKPNKRYEVCMLKTTKCCWEQLKMPLNGEVYILFVDQKAPTLWCQFFQIDQTI